MDLTAIISANNDGPLTVYRTAAPTQNEFGGFDAATPSEVTLDPVTVHALNGEDLEQLPEADRTSETIQIYAAQELYVAAEGHTADRVLYAGRTYRIIHLEPCRHGGVWIAYAALEED